MIDTGPLNYVKIVLHVESSPSIKATNGVAQVEYLLEGMMFASNCKLCTFQVGPRI